MIDGDGRLAGVITIDDAMEVLEEETEEDMRLLAGVGDEELSDGVAEIARGRFVWLTVNLGTAILASAVIGLFSDTIQRLRGAGDPDADRGVDGRQRRDPDADGGGAGAGDAQPDGRRTWRRFIGREGLVGLINGLGFAALIGVLSGLYFAGCARSGW